MTVNHFSSGTWTPRLYDCFHIREQLARISPCCEGTAVAKERQVSVHWLPLWWAKAARSKEVSNDITLKAQPWSLLLGEPPYFFIHTFIYFIYLHIHLLMPAMSPFLFGERGERPKDKDDRSSALWEVETQQWMHLVTHVIRETNILWEFRGRWCSRGRWEKGGGMNISDYYLSYIIPFLPPPNEVVIHILGVHTELQRYKGIFPRNG